MAERLAREEDPVDGILEVVAVRIRKVQTGQASGRNGWIICCDPHCS
jgi:hypothetical protein